MHSYLSRFQSEVILQPAPDRKGISLIIIDKCLEGKEKGIKTAEFVEAVAPL